MAMKRVAKSTMVSYIFSSTRKFDIVPLISLPNAMKKPVVWQNFDCVVMGLRLITTTEKMKYHNPRIKQPAMLNMINLPESVNFQGNHSAVGI
jgi:hypothetical protein